MTHDELEQEIVNIRKRGLSPFVEHTLISEKRRVYYSLKMERDMENYDALIRKNVNFLERIYKVYAGSHNIKDSIGIEPHPIYAEIHSGRKKYMRLESVLYIAYFYGIPYELLYTVDLEANERTLKNQYPLIFKQSQH
jgi:hypothetical protein